MDIFVAMLAALGHASRLTIFRFLVRVGPDGCCVDDIKQRLRMPGSTLSHHLDALARCGLIAPRRDGRFIYYAVDWPRTAQLVRYLTEDCCADMHSRLSLAPTRSRSRPLQPVRVPRHGGQTRRARPPRSHQ